MSADPAVLPPPSPFLAEVWEQIDCQGPALDLACGRGRNARGLIARGETVVAIDRNADALKELRATVPADAPLLTVRADLERGDAIPAATGSFGAVIVFRYLHRPLSGEIERMLRPGGWLIYETFTREQAGFEFGPNRREFLLEPGELPKLFPGLHPDRFEEVLIEAPRREALARLVARKPR